MLKQSFRLRQLSYQTQSGYCAKDGWKASRVDLIAAELKLYGGAVSESRSVLERFVGYTTAQSIRWQNGSLPTSNPGLRLLPAGTAIVGRLNHIVSPMFEVPFTQQKCLVHLLR